MKISLSGFAVAVLSGAACVVTAMCQTVEIDGRIIARASTIP